MKILQNGYTSVLLGLWDDLKRFLQILLKSNRLTAAAESKGHKMAHTRRYFLREYFQRKICNKIRIYVNATRIANISGH